MLFCAVCATTNKKRKKTKQMKERNKKGWDKRRKYTYFQLHSIQTWIKQWNDAQQVQHYYTAHRANCARQTENNKYIYIELMLAFHLLILTFLHSLSKSHSITRIQLLSRPPPPLASRHIAQLVHARWFIAPFMHDKLEPLCVCFVDLMRKVTFPFVEGWNCEKVTVDSVGITHYGEIYADNFVEL